MRVLESDGVLVFSCKYFVSNKVSFINKFSVHNVFFGREE